MKVPIFCYHKVGLEAEEGRWLTISPTRLASHVAFFARRRYRFGLPRELTNWPTEPTVVFTFDDAYETALRLAVPIFEKHRGTAAFYAVSSLVGKASEWDGDRARPLATWEALLETQRRGFEIGNHTVSHPKLADCANPETEVQSAHELLTQHGLAVQTLAYPYGSVSLVAAQRYDVALALGKRPALATDLMKALPRIVVSYGDALPMLLYKLHLRPRLR